MIDPLFSAVINFEMRSNTCESTTIDYSGQSYYKKERKKTNLLRWLWFGWANMMALVEMQSEKWPRNAIPHGEKKKEKSGRKKKETFKDSLQWEHENLNSD